MGLRGARAQKRVVYTVDDIRERRHRAPWRKRGLSRAQKVIAFLETLPITKGILAGTTMKLLPGQRKFVKAIYGRLDKDGRRLIKLAIKTEPRGNGKTGLLAGLALCHLLGPEAEARGEVYSLCLQQIAGRTDLCGNEGNNGKRPRIFRAGQHPAIPQADRGRRRRWRWQFV